MLSQDPGSGSFALNQTITLTVGKYVLPPCGPTPTPTPMHLGLGNGDDDHHPDGADDPDLPTAIADLPVIRTGATGRVTIGR